MKTINPTFGQALEYAFKTGYGVQLFLGVALLIGAVVFMIMRYKYDKRLGNGFVFNFPFIVAFLVLGIAITLVLIKPISIQTDNAKPVTAEQLKFYQDKGDGMKSFWDSVYLNNKMLGADKR
jgi:hypothetical protein